MLNFEYYLALLCFNVVWISHGSPITDGKRFDKDLPLAAYPLDGWMDNPWNSWTFDPWDSWTSDLDPTAFPWDRWTRDPDDRDMPTTDAPDRWTFDPDKLLFNNTFKSDPWDRRTSDPWDRRTSDSLDELRTFDPPNFSTLPPRVWTSDPWDRRTSDSHDRERTLDPSEIPYDPWASTPGNRWTFDWGWLTTEERDRWTRDDWGWLTTEEPDWWTRDDWGWLTTEELDWWTPDDWGWLTTEERDRWTRDDWGWSTTEEPDWRTRDDWNRFTFPTMPPPRPENDSSSGIHTTFIVFFVILGVLGVAGAFWNVKRGFPYGRIAVALPYVVHPPPATSGNPPEVTSIYVAPEQGDWAIPAMLDRPPEYAEVVGAAVGRNSFPQVHSRMIPDLTPPSIEEDSAMRY